MNFLHMGSGHQLFFGHAKFEVKNFSKFFHLHHAGGVFSPTFFVHAKFEVKKFSKFFCLHSALDSEFFRGGVWAPTFFGYTKFETKNFLDAFFLESTLDSEFFIGGVWSLTLSVMPNLTPKIFRNFLVYRALWTEFFRGGCEATFFGYAKFETKKYFGMFLLREYSGL